MRHDGQWWAKAVVYQVYVRSFADSDGDGVGDLAGVRSRLGYLELLGVDALALGPVNPSPGVDHGYDVTDPREVDPLLGTLDDLDGLIADAHAHGLRVVVDVVPNHTSDQHEWFRAAVSAAPGSPERARYHFHPGKGERGERPPNNWQSVFGGPAWTRLTVTDEDGTSRPDEWYLHLFAPGQPDLDWENPEVWADLEKTLRFWCDRGVDGLRIDVAHGMAKAAGLPDDRRQPGWTPVSDELTDPRFDQEPVHDVHRMIRAVLDHYPERMAVGEVGTVRDDGRWAGYVRRDELHLAVHSALRDAAFDAGEVREAVDRTLAAAGSAGVPAVWMLANHDLVRPATRYGEGPLGLARARAMALVALALPGTAYLYHGDELGLPDVEVPEEARQDPAWELSGHTDPGRDGARVPLPWEGGPPGYGFTTGTPWLPVPDGFGALTAAEQLEDPDSTLSLFRQALELRRSHPAFHGDEVEWFGAPAGCLAFRRTGSTLVCALNAGDRAVPLPPGDVLLTSAPLTDCGELPPDTAAWLA
ncbi:glycoside hydrolase family 13 protein [Pseudonocardia kujensis]|uniref:glycoside hydrolase family 13 protein n=1 Tax=Pseudonocardia kujensis TaxID=1128675 RepID=UPI001E5D2D42|nr:glycoside hydrolase family 13 protein [Pseudonocardia kujensis]MCE0764376.1 glycoside hydrolase family 13 protein [Pseudonocardia kujensis]